MTTLTNIQLVQLYRNTNALNTKKMLEIYAELDRRVKTSTFRYQLKLNGVIIIMNNPEDKI